MSRDKLVDVGDPHVNVGFQGKSGPGKIHEVTLVAFKGQDIYSLRHRKCGVRGFIHELFVSKTRTSEVRASEGF